jgi:hypothetical protein
MGRAACTEPQYLYKGTVYSLRLTDKISVTDCVPYVQRKLYFGLLNKCYVDYDGGDGDDNGDGDDDDDDGDENQILMQ